MKEAFLNLLLLSFFGLATAGPGYEVGEVVSDFNLKNIDGKMVSLSDYKRGEGVILVFTCNHCPYSKLYEQRIIDLHNTYAPQGYPVVAVNPNDPKKVPEDSFENMQKRARKKNYPFVYLFDESQDVARSFGASKTPHVYLLKKTKALFKVIYIGAIDNNSQSANSAEKLYVADAISSLKNGESVKVTETKAVGCSIKWRD
jgi:peroxiredoxin